MDITVSLLAYGEAENLKVLLPRIKKAISAVTDSFEIRIIDGAVSKDNTAEVCRYFQVDYVNQETPYYGGAYRTAIKYSKGDLFAIMDADGSHDPKDIARLYEKLQSGYDVVIGSRYVKGARTQDSKKSVLMSKCLNLAFRIALGLKVRDVSNSFRIYKTEPLKKLELECNNYDMAEEILFKLQLNDPKIKMAEVPIVFSKRMEGESKRNLWMFIISYIKSLLKFIGLRLGSRRG